MKGTASLLVSSLLLTGLFSIVAFGETLEKRWAIGLGNPYLSVKYRGSAKTAYEVRGAFGSGINTYSARFYRILGSREKSYTFIGLEGGTINFQKADIAGNGSFGMLFVGFESRIGRSIAFSVDIGPAYIHLSSEGTSVQGVEWLYNLGINLYFR